MPYIKVFEAFKKKLDAQAGFNRNTVESTKTRLLKINV